MKNMTKNFIALLSLIACGSVFALQTSQIMLPVPGDGSIKPRQSIKLSLDPLVVPAPVAYDVICTIDNPSYQDPSPVYMNFSSEGISFVSQYELNKSIVNNNAILSTAQEDNSYEAHHVNMSNKGTSLVFTNLDADNTVTLKNCYGIPTTN